MSNALTFLGLALLIAVIGAGGVLAYHRMVTSQSADGVEEFRRMMSKLSPEQTVGDDRPPNPLPNPLPDDPAQKQER